MDINEEQLEAARRILATTTVKEALEEAFREIARAEARREEVEALSEMKGMDLGDPEIMSQVWRSLESST